jgi:hypothetical protein
MCIYIDYTYSMMHAGSINSDSRTADMAAAMGLVRMVVRLLLMHGCFFMGCWVSLSMMVPTAGAWTTTITTTTTRATIWKDLRSKSNNNNDNGDDGIDGKDDDVVVPSPILSLRRRDFVQQSVATVTAISTATATAIAATTTGGVGIITTASNWIRPTISQAAEMLPTTTTTATTVAAEATTTAAGITLPPMGLGAWAWGDSLFWGCKWKLLFFLYCGCCCCVCMLGFEWRRDRYFVQTFVSTSTF